MNRLKIIKVVNRRLEILKAIKHIEDRGDSGEMSYSLDELYDEFQHCNILIFDYNSLYENRNNKVK